MNDKNLHPHTAIWILCATVLLGILAYGGYLWHGMTSSGTANQVSTTTDANQVLDSLRSTSTPPDTAGKAPPVDNKTLTSLKSKNSATTSAEPGSKVNNSVLDSLKAH